MPAFSTRRCYNRFPDEKGTESVFSCANQRGRFSSIVTTVSPMKRGLKEFTRQAHEIAEYVTTVSPMKRGLKG